MEYGIDPWADWPYGAHEPGVAREISEVLQFVKDHEQESSERSLYEKYTPLEEGFIERLENVVGTLDEEVSMLEIRKDYAEGALRRLERFLERVSAREDEDPPWEEDE